MRFAKLPKLLVLAGVLGLTVVPLRASDPVGVYCIVERVVLEPNDTEPTAVKIWGAFALSTAPFSGNTYQPVAKGYLYYTCPQGRDAACLGEWSDLKKLAGKDEIIGFGNRYGNTLTHVHAATAKAVSPDVYPLNIGLVRMGHYAGVTYPDLSKALREAIKGK